MRSAVILIIGDEILHGEISDRNGPWLIDEFNEAGIKVGRCCILPDDPDVISRYIRRAFKDGHDYVVTTGGIGPTHDDRTLEAVGQALDRPLEEDTGLIDLLESKHGTLSESQRKMARLPRGCEYHHLEDSIGMAFEVEDVYVFPGFPELLKPLFFKLRDNFEGTDHFTRTLETDGLESDIAPQLGEFQDRFPELQFGSYPHTDGSITLKIRGQDADRVETAREELRDELGLNDS